MQFYPSHHHHHPNAHPHFSTHNSSSTDNYPLLPLPTSSTNTTTNTSTSTPSSVYRDEDLAKVEMAVLAAIFVLAVFGNATVLYVLRKIGRHKKLSRMNSMIIHLTAADLFVEFFHVFPQLAWKGTFHFQGGRCLCKLVTYGQLVAMFAASYVLVTTAIDRYLAICHPLEIHAWGRRRMRGLVAVAWLISFVFALPQTVIFSYGPHPAAPQINDCIGEFEPLWTLPVYVTWVTLSIYLLPLLILVTLYTRICLTVWRSASIKDTKDRKVLESPLMGPSSAAVGFTRNPRAHVRVVSQAKVKTVKLTLVVIANYVICYAPFFISQMWAAWDEAAPFEGKAMVIIMLLASLTSCTNPWIYLAFNDRFSLVLSSCFVQLQVRSGNQSTTESTTFTKSTITQSIGTTRKQRIHSTITTTTTTTTRHENNQPEDGEGVPNSPTTITTPLDGDFRSASSPVGVMGSPCSPGRDTVSRF